MKTELQNKLLKKYPQFFAHVENLKIYTGEKSMHEEVTELLNQKEIVLPIQFGFECGNGWYMLLDELMSCIEWHLNPKHSYPRKERIPFGIDQIKEKFSTLRFYYHGGDDEIAGMVSLAESLSGKICENCGTTINVGCTSGWLTTLCESCALKQRVIGRWKKNLEE